MNLARVLPLLGCLVCISCPRPAASSTCLDVELELDLDLNVDVRDVPTGVRYAIDRDGWPWFVFHCEVVPDNTCEIERVYRVEPEGTLTKILEVYPLESGEFVDAYYNSSPERYFGVYTVPVPEPWPDICPPETRYDVLDDQAALAASFPGGYEYQAIGPGAQTAFAYRCPILQDRTYFLVVLDTAGRELLAFDDEGESELLYRNAETGAFAVWLSEARVIRWHTAELDHVWSIEVDDLPCSGTYPDSLHISFTPNGTAVVWCDDSTRLLYRAGSPDAEFELSPTVERALLVPPAGDTILEGAGGALALYDTRTGERIWNKTGLGEIMSIEAIGEHGAVLTAVTSLDGTVTSGSGEYWVRLLDAAGRTLWKSVQPIGDPILKNKRRLTLANSNVEIRRIRTFRLTETCTPP